jgi:transposase InsO family protein
LEAAGVTVDHAVENDYAYLLTDDPAVGVIHHSDHGSQYTALTFQERCRAAGIRSSMGSVGDSSENDQRTRTAA